MKTTVNERTVRDNTRHSAVRGNPDVLSPIQQRILAYVREYIAEHGWAPTVRDIGREIDYKSPSSVAYQLGQLEAKGWLKASDKPRALALVEPVADPCLACGGTGRAGGETP